MSTALSNSKTAEPSGSFTSTHGPDDWQIVPIRNILLLDQPGAWGDEPTPPDPGVRVLRAADLTRDGRVIPTNAAYRRLSERDQERRLMKDGDLILERSGGGPGAPVGRVALVQGMGAIYCNNFCQQLRVDRDQCIPQYAARVLWHIYEQGVTARLEHQTTGIRNLDYAAYLAHPIPLPPLPEQRAIANILDSIDEAIEATDALVSATEQLRDSLLHNLLTRGLPGHHTQWKEVPVLGTIPANWNVAKLGDIAGVAFSSVDKKTIEGEEAVKLCNYTDVFYNRRIKPDMAFMSATATPIERDQWNLQKGDVIFTKDSETPDEIGIPAYVTETMEEVLCGYHLGVARPSAELIDGAFLSELMASPMLSRQFARVANGVTRFGLTLKATTSLNVPVPPLAEQQAMAALFESVDEAIEKRLLDREGLQKLKKSASDALLTGQVRVAGSVKRCETQ